VRGADGNLRTVQLANSFGARTGDCISGVPAPQGKVDTVELNPCSGPHEHRVFATPAVPTLDGSVGIADAAGNVCAATARGPAKRTDGRLPYAADVSLSWDMHHAACFTTV
jgi:hypothetical protein